MKRTSLASLSLAAALAFAGSASPAAATPLPAAPLLRIMPLGDSITAGAYSSTEAGYRAPLWGLMTAQTRYTPDFVGSGSFGAAGDPDNEGHSGWTIDQVRAEIDRWQDAARPDVILLHLGINDLKWHAADPENAARRLLDLVDRLQTQRPGTTVIVLGLLTDTPGLEAQTQAFNSVIQGQQASRQATGQHFRYVAPPRLDVAAELPDGLHPNDAGYRKLATTYNAAVEEAVTDGWTRRTPAPRAGTESGGTGPVRWADFDGDGRTDQLTIADSGEVRARLNRASGWQDVGRIATGVTTDRARVRFADFDGDGKADYLLIAPGGGVSVYLNKGGDAAGPNGWQHIGQVAWGTTTRHEQVRFADWDGDGRTDYITIADNGALTVHLNRGGDPTGAAGWVGLGQVATGTTQDRSRVRLADLDGDGRADYNTVNPDGSLTTYLNRGGDRHGGWQNLGRTASGVTTEHEHVQLADVNGDTHADYLNTATDGATHGYLFNGGDTAGPGGWTYIGTLY
ncbi:MULTISPECIES: FG-GAP-like repeat-containing protein [unclassified Streptomyces]|uniref:FG-GAP-like repeat-containing protein n=1 Tax=unclassified Streptomyces TaxID=2593676 RepID=UPI003330503D